MNSKAADRASRKARNAELKRLGWTCTPVQFQTTELDYDRRPMKVWRAGYEVRDPAGALVGRHWKLTEAWEWLRTEAFRRDMQRAMNEAAP